MFLLIIYLTLFSSCKRLVYNRLHSNPFVVGFARQEDGATSGVHITATNIENLASKEIIKSERINAKPRCQHPPSLHYQAG